MPVSNLLDELSEIRDRTLYTSFDGSRVRGLNDNYAPIRYDEISLDHIFRPIREHVDHCENCHGIFIAAERIGSNRSSVYYNNEKYFYIICTCGIEWCFPIEYMSVQFHGIYIEDMVAKISLEIRNYNSKNRIIERIFNKPVQQEIPKQFKNAIESLEVI